jgi:phosphatidylinositol-4,5-bisphosphate 3-kinase
VLCIGVLGTGKEQGFIEVRDNTIFVQYFEKLNPGQKDYQDESENFLFSSAGCAVATCVLGITDWHPGNIMLQTSSSCASTSTTSSATSRRN